MDRNSGFNIITGEVRPNYPLNTSNRRFSAVAELRRAKDSGEFNYPLTQTRRLGTSSDAKKFHYSYSDSANQPALAPNKSDNLAYNNEKVSLINASKLPYNPITHTISHSSTAKWDNPHKIAPLSKQTHQGRFNAPNYSKQFAERLATNATDFHRKKSACSELCHIQKSYGVDKFFRKFK